eukprot:1844357-Pyramimonas_sp.AAC.1
MGKDKGAHKGKAVLMPTTARPAPRAPSPRRRLKRRATNPLGASAPSRSLRRATWRLEAYDLPLRRLNRHG